jgi:hypothetical protein
MKVSVDHLMITVGKKERINIYIDNYQVFGGKTEADAISGAWLMWFD